MSYIGKQPTKAALTASDIEDGIITAAKIEDGAVVAAEIASNAVTTAKINADAVTGAKIADDAINSEHYTDGSIDTAHLADGQVTTTKLATAVFTGATDIGADIADADLFLMDDGAGGTIRKTAASRLKTYIGSVGGATGLDVNDNVKIRLGTGNDTELFFDGTNTILDHTSGSGGLFIRADGIAIQDTQGTPVNYIDVNQGAGVIFNEGSNDLDFRIESNASSHFFNLDAGASTLSFGGDDASDNDKGKFKILADGQTRFGGFAGNPNANGGTGLSESDNRNGSLMMDKSGGFTHQTTNPNSYWNYRGSSSNECYWNFRYGGSHKGSILWNSSAVAFNTSSDYRLKENVDYTWDATTRLKQLKPARFNWIADETNTLIDGFIAHEAATVVPGSVSGTKDAVEQYDEFSEEVKAGTKNVGDNRLDDGGNTIIKPQSIDHSKLVPLLVKTIQELEARIKTLEDA